MTTPPAAVTRSTPIGLYAGISITLPDRIAERLPVAREGVHPHLTLVHAQVSPDQIWRLRARFEGRTHSASLGQLDPFRVGLSGVGDFRTEASAAPVVYLQVADGADQLGRLAAAFDAEYGLGRRFTFCPHVTLAWRNRDLELAEGDAELDQLAADFADFKDEFEVQALTFQTAHGTILAPRSITWHRPRTYPLR